MHFLCTICSDLMNQESIFATKCGHLFHHICLARWIERSQSCPQCRHKVTKASMFRIYPTISNESTGDDAATLQYRLKYAELQLQQQKASAKEKDDKLTSITAELKKKSEELKKLKDETSYKTAAAATAFKTYKEKTLTLNRQLAEQLATAKRNYDSLKNEKKASELNKSAPNNLNHVSSFYEEEEYEEKYEDVYEEEYEEKYEDVYEEEYEEETYEEYDFFLD